MHAVCTRMGDGAGTRATATGGTATGAGESTPKRNGGSADTRDWPRTNHHKNAAATVANTATPYITQRIRFPVTIDNNSSKDGATCYEEPHIAHRGSF